ARKRERFAGARHANINEAAFLFDAFFFVDRAAVWADAFFHAGKKNVIEFEALGAMQRDERDAGLVFERVGVAYERSCIQKIGERFARVHAFGDGSREFFKIFDAGDIVRRIAVAQHAHVTGFVENVVKEVRWFAILESLLEAKDKFIKGA